ncbi:MAG: M56 family metallopeptidase [bacterium]|nr:M56 family metallopeptidase [bacterium]
MGDIFFKLFNMSITAGWLILAVLCVRFLFRKMPKWMNCLLWGVVALRLLMPFSVESAFSLQPSSEPMKSSVVVEGVVTPYVPAVDSRLPFIENTVNPLLRDAFAYDRTDSVAPMQLFTHIAGVVWLGGMIVLLLLALISIVRLILLVREAVCYREHVYLCDAVKTPFIMGVIRPGIYLPSTLSEGEINYILAHEEAHLKRFDHLWKPIGYLILCVYWFQPLCWIAYMLMCKDIELACDEKVIKDMSFEDKKNYSKVLLSCATQRRFVMRCPLAFGEVGVKERVKSVLNYKKPGFWAVVLAVMFCAVFAVCFLTNPATSVDEQLAAYIDCQIASHYQTDETLGNFSCLDWQMIGKEKNGNQTTLYLWVMYEEFSKAPELKVETSAHALTSITVERENESYDLVEYWEPEDGSSYMDSIKKKLPMRLWNKAIRSENCYEKQAQALEELAKAHYENIAPLSLNDVIMLSQKGYDLTWADFEQYDYVETGSGLYIRVYKINQQYELWIGGSGPDCAPMYIYLCLADDRDTRIDIRDGGVTEFLSAILAL